MYEVLIIGGGPAGLTAAIYTGRFKRKTRLITGPNVGGQIFSTYTVDNYPGFPEGITGPDLVDRLVNHVERFGAEMDERWVESVDFSSIPYKVVVSGECFEAKTVIIAAGSDNRKLGLESESKFMGRGLFICATCDAALYEDLRVVVVGGGDSAVQEALDLTKYAKEVIIIHRGETLSAKKYLIEGATANSKISILFHTEVMEILGGDYVTGIRLRNTKSGVETKLDTEGVLLALGGVPNTELFRDQLEITEAGFIASRDVKTEKPGVFVAGDINDAYYRQLATACGSGCKAALEAERYLTQNE